MNEFPKWLYHNMFPPVLVASADEAAELGEGWAESPAEFGVISAPSVQQAAEVQRRKMAGSMLGKVRELAVTSPPPADPPPPEPTRKK